ncbi:MAG: DUF192 domain-containing protein [Candidatus Micrarchaeota archaeon]
MAFIYTQYNVAKKQITITNKNGKKVVVTVEMADDMLKKSRGLMFRDALGENDGMLFTFDKPARHGFWMVNTTLALDAIYFDENKTAVDVLQMEPCKILNCPVYWPKADALYVLEVNKGFAMKNNITVGSKFEYS